MKRSLCLLLFAVALPILLARPADDKADDGRAAAGDDELVGKVKKSIDDAIDYLKGQQQPGGEWAQTGGAGYEGGWTGLATLALLQAGVPPTDKCIQNGLKALRKVTPRHTYVVGLQTMVFCLAGDKDDAPRIKRNVEWLESALTSDGWGYVNPPTSKDNSNTQYAMLGLHEAIQAGYPVSEKTLTTVRDLYLNTQHKDGGWAYDPRSKSGAYLTMTTSGLCNLLITGLDLAKGKAVLLDDGSAKDCGKYVDNKAVVEACAWLGNNFPAEINNENAVRLRSPFYALYGIERAGRLSGQRFFGGHDWYEVGCRWLTKTQRANGSWAGAGAGHTFDREPVLATGFALLFLAKGRTPVLVSKMAYGAVTSSGWNNKRSDMKNLTDYCGKEIFKNRPLAWQVFDIRNADAPDPAARRRLAAQLAQTPIVYFNGHVMAPRGKEMEVLKEYLENGGFLIAENCCGKAKHPDFDKDFRRLIKDLFPDAKLEALEAEHPIWMASGKFASSPKDFPLEGVKRGCKTIAVYSPVPLAGYWESNERKDGSKALKAFQLGANIVAYATGLEAPRPRLSRAEIAGDVPKEPVKRGFFRVGQLRHDGDWQPAPKAMRNLMLEARKAGIDVVLKPEAMFPGDEAVASHRFLYMHGRKKFEYTREELKLLRFNLRSGGLLLADACCGATEFDASFRKFVEALFGDEKLALEPVPADDRLWGKELNGEAITRVNRRVPKAGGRPEMQSLPPALEGLKYKGRWVILYTKVDIGCALEKHASTDCISHDHDSALKVGRAAVLYALTR